jgi:hypothetical protein
MIFKRREALRCANNTSKPRGAAVDADRVLLSDPVLQFVTLGSTSKIARYTSG